MIGYRGALRYMLEPDLFKLELDAIRRVWDEGTNYHMMIPFVQTPASSSRRAQRDRRGGPARRARLRALGDGRGAVRPLPPAPLRGAGNRRDWIGSNDLTQLMLGARPRLRARRRGLRRARRGGRRVPAAADPRARARPADLDLRAGPSVHPSSARSCSSGPGSTPISVNIDAVDRGRTRRGRRAARSARGPPARDRGVTCGFRIHGRGGRGVVAAAELLSVAAFDEGKRPGVPDVRIRSRRAGRLLLRIDDEPDPGPRADRRAGRADRPV